jgi:hypothetical protein
MGPLPAILGRAFYGLVQWAYEGAKDAWVRYHRRQKVIDALVEPLVRQAEQEETIAALSRHEEEQKLMAQQQELAARLRELRKKK